MKNVRIYAFIALTLACVLLLSGCSAFVQLFENELVRGYTEVVLDAIVSEDLDGAYAIFEDICTKDDFAPVFYEMKELIKDVEDYELKILSVNQNTDFSGGEGVTVIRSVYEMKAESGKYIVDVSASSLYPKLASFHIAPFEATDYYYTGTITNMKDAGVIQWVLLLSNLLVIGAAVFAFVDCIRNKIKLKALWIVVIILGFFTVGFTLSGGSFNLNLNLGWLTAYSALIRYGGGTLTARFMIPLGTAVYFILRHWMIKRPKPETPVATVSAPAEPYAPAPCVQMPEETPADCPEENEGE